MEEQRVNFETAVLAKEKEFDGLCFDAYNTHKMKYSDGWLEYIDDNEIEIPFTSKVLKPEDILSPTQSLLQKFIRETRGVHIEIHRNASGYYWSMCKSDGGTDLGWSDIAGLNPAGVWDSFEDALENALQVQLSYDLPNDITIIKHWGNYVEFALKSK